MTPHIKAQKSDFAPVVLMPGDPLRAEWIAQTFLQDVVQVNSVRGMLAFTGYYKNHQISVMAHGMGNPSMGIYSHELFDPNKFDVQAIIRVGSCGALVPEVKVRDVILATSAFSESCYAYLVGIKHEHHVLKATPQLVTLAQETAKKLNIVIRNDQVYSSDVFYAKESVEETIAKTHASVVEMEAYALYANALLHHKQGLCLLTVSDSLVTHESMSPKERQTSFSSMVQLALETAIQVK